MTARRFVRYQLRTTDPAAARGFYAEIFGGRFFGPEISITPLPERARIRGAPPHWLGHLGTPAVAAAARRMIADGGQLLGPTQPTVDDSSTVTLRDPFGAVLALTPQTPGPRSTAVAWHLLHAFDHEQAFALYAELFDWTQTQAWDAGPALGRHRVFAWDESDSSIGSVADTARQPAIHPQWLFYFPVPNLEDSHARVRSLGGIALEPVRTWTGDLVAACDDPQGAAFGLFQRAG